MDGTHTVHDTLLPNHALERRIHTLQIPKPRPVDARPEELAAEANVDLADAPGQEQVRGREFLVVVERALGQAAPAVALV